jgi:Ser/Thr protein kinase RdoA (MazF antagonist)
MEGEELRQVLAHWDLGEVSSIQQLHRGSTRAPKVVIDCADGRFLLKRLANERTDANRIAFQHRVHRSLQAAGYPVPELVPLRRMTGTLLEREGFAYELCRYVDGRRYEGSIEDARSSGSRLAGFHDLTARHVTESPPGAGFHDRADVYKAAKGLHKTRPELDEPHCTLLARMLKTARTAVSVHWDALPICVVHGDWHPGNLLFGSMGVVAVLDLETVRAEPRVAEIANALLHFSMPVGGGGGPDQLPPDAPEMDMLEALAHGYRLVSRAWLQEDEINVLPDLMLEALTVEAVIALHRHGGFGQWSGPAFLNFVCRRAAWIAAHADALRTLASDG